MNKFWQFLFLLILVILVGLNCGGGGEEEGKNGSDDTTGPEAKLEAPVLYELQGDESGLKVVLNWSQVEGAEKYRVYFGEDIDSRDYFYAIYEGKDTSFTHDPADSVGYYYVVGFKGTTEGEPSTAGWTVPWRRLDEDLGVYELNDSTAISGFYIDIENGKLFLIDPRDASAPVLLDFYVTDFKTGTSSGVYFASANKLISDPGIETGEIPSGDWKINGLGSLIDTSLTFAPEVYSDSVPFNGSYYPFYISQDRDRYYGQFWSSGGSYWYYKVTIGEIILQPVKNLRLIPR